MFHRAVAPLEPNLAATGLQPTNKRAAKTTNGQRSTLHAPLGSLFEALVLIEQTQSSFRIYKSHNVGQIECENFGQHRIPEVCIRGDYFPWSLQPTEVCEQVSQQYFGRLTCLAGSQTNTFWSNDAHQRSRRYATSILSRSHTKFWRKTLYDRG